MQAHIVPPLNTKAITALQIDIDINIITGIPNTIAMVITTETNHTVKIHTIEHIIIDTAIEQGVSEIEEFSECRSDCTDLSDCEEQVNNETPDNTKN